MNLWKIEFACPEDLAKAWHIDNDDFWEETTDEHGRSNRIDIIENYIWDNYQKEHKIVHDMRLFLSGIIKGKRRYYYGNEIYKGLSKIKDNDTFVKYFCTLLPYMWV